MVVPRPGIRLRKNMKSRENVAAQGSLAEDHVRSRTHRRSCGLGRV